MRSYEHFQDPAPAKPPKLYPPLPEQQNGEQSLQNNFWSLAADIRRPEKQPIVFEGR